MSDAITVIAPKSLDEAKSLSDTLAKATLLPAALRGKTADVLMTLMAGAELGLGPIQSIRSIHVIDGKPTLSADLIAALCLRRSDVCEYLQPTESSATKATYTAKRKGAPAAVTMSFAIEDAQRAGLAGKGNWAKYPAAMLRARCVSAICRAVFPDLVGGLYDSDSEEIEAPRDVTPRPTPPNVIDSTAVVEPTERTALEAAVAAATSEAELTALVERITRLAAADKAKVRAQWGARRDELRNAALAMAAVVPEQTEAVPS
jgi:hypothetical protein